MIRLVRVLFAVLGILIGVQSGSPNSVDSKEKPAVNIVGTLLDTSGREYQLEYITIAGRYAQIPVYQKPDNNDQNPEINTTKIDLVEVDEIRPREPGQILTFNRREYVELTILFKGSKRTQNTYIIERNKEVRAEEFLGDRSHHSLDHEFKFLAIRTLKIFGIKNKEREWKQEAEQLADMHDIAITRTRKLLDEIEQTAHNIPEQSSSMTRDLKGQLLYLVDELKKTFMQWFA